MRRQSAPFTNRQRTPPLPDDRGWLPLSAGSSCELAAARQRHAGCLAVLALAVSVGDLRRSDHRRRAKSRPVRSVRWSIPYETEASRTWCLRAERGFVETAPAATMHKRRCHRPGVDRPGGKRPGDTARERDARHQLAQERPNRADAPLHEGYDVDPTCDWLAVWGSQTPSQRGSVLANVDGPIGKTAQVFGQCFPCVPEPPLRSNGDFGFFAPIALPLTGDLMRSAWAVIKLRLVRR
jgi:hypothetical protein